MLNRSFVASLVKQMIIPLALACCALPTSVYAWSHQGHILISRLAALRIIQDPQAPAELKSELQNCMPYTLDDCRKLAVGDFVGEHPADHFLSGLDGACTLPDRYQLMADGRKPIAPYQVDEGKLHFMDLEFFSSVGEYRDDLSGMPKIADIPHDLKDPRYKLSGYVPFRLEESYNNLVAELKKAPGTSKPESTLHWLGYMMHYAEDIHQPQHSTADYKSLSYLAVAKVPGVRTIRRELSDGRTVMQYQVDRDKSRQINPHGDIEFQLFENNDEPRGAFRKEYWDLLINKIDILHQQLPASLSTSSSAPIFDSALAVLEDSYQNLPLIGHAAASAYKTGSFSPAVFFPYKDSASGPSILEMIATQNAKAVLYTEILIRRAWAQAHP